MIVSHEHSFVFVHTRKVAGSSIKVALAPHLGDDDILIGSWNEVLDAGVGLNREAKRIMRMASSNLVYGLARGAGKTRSEAINVAIKAYYRRLLSVNPPHPRLDEIKACFAQQWQRSFRFAFVRNPYEQAASDYCWRMRMTGKKATFREYLEQYENQGSRRRLLHPGTATNWEMIAGDDGVEVDFVGRYETLESDFRNACRLAGLPALDIGRREKANSDQVEYGALYGPKEKELVRRIFARELEHFGYEFPYS